jgi:hypothetical protein
LSHFGCLFPGKRYLYNKFNGDFVLRIDLGKSETLSKATTETAPDGIALTEM